ncbi:MAG TPA: hypothetical protein P5164_16170 [Thermoanaerobaculia bacterium]|jgi:hypothetical protein|nr:hypothetical protein [Thermoanaerobaculia bacterium]
MTTLFLVGLVLLLLGSFSESGSKAARRLRRLDPGGRDDFGGRLR